MSFFEFLDAMNRSMLRKALEEIQAPEPIAEPLHLELIHLLKTYYYVGGMPKSVLSYLETGDFGKVREVQEDILKAYMQDFAKHAPPSLVMRIMLIWNSIPIHLGKRKQEVHLFSDKKKCPAPAITQEALQWLIDAELVYKVTCITTPKLPLLSYGDHEAFKVYLFDVGLSAMCRLTSRIIVEGSQIFVEFKGSLTENYVAGELKTALGGPLFYWTSEREAEVDFLVEDDGDIFPLEVKSGTSTKKKKSYDLQ